MVMIIKTHLSAYSRIAVSWVQKDSREDDR